MDVLKKLFPISFQKAGSVADLIVGILIYLVIAVAASALIWLATLLVGWIPVVGGLVGWLVGIIGTIVDIYVVAGIIIELLAFFKILK